ncbi:MAG: protein kinase, partial [Planctomycetes bacterium]|nr:protein kinase [Planctomycetota bacterium]
LLEVVGHGSKGSVYRAWQTALRRLVAVKVLSREFTGNKEELSRFVREARIAAKLNHPALVRAYDIGQTAEALYIVLEYVEGETLQQLLKRDQRLPVSRT